MGLPCLPESPGLPEDVDTYSSDFSDTDCLAKNCQAQCTDTGDTRCRNYELHSGRACGFGGQAGMEEVKSLPYPRCWVLTCRLMPTMERRTLPQLGHRHLYITFTEFWQRDRPCHFQPSSSIPLHRTLAQLEPPPQNWDPPSTSAAVPFSCAEQVRRGEMGQNRSQSRRPPGKSSEPRWSTWGCRRGGGAKGWRCRCPRSNAHWWCCCRCPRRHHSPSRDRILPVRLQGGDTRCHPHLRTNQTPPGERSAPRLDNPRQQFASIYLFI